MTAPALAGSAASASSAAISARIRVAVVDRPVTVSELGLVAADALPGLQARDGVDALVVEVEHGLGALLVDKDGDLAAGGRKLELGGLLLADHQAHRRAGD